MRNLKNLTRVLLIMALIASCIFVQSPVINAESAAAAAVQCGDVNSDGSVDAIDFALLKSYILGKTTSINKEAAETNADSSVDAIDLANLQKFLLGTISKLPVVSNNKIVALTFDDGPDVTLTPLVLDKLDKYKVPATFMMIGQKLNDSTAPVVRRIINMGCEIGNHSWGYSSMSGMQAAEIKKSVSDTNAAILKYSGTTPKFFRAPNLSISSTMLSAIDLTFVNGVTCNDWVQSTSAQERANAIISGARDGAIFLMHDVQPLPHPTPEALDIIIPTLKNQGYEFVTLSQLFERKGVKLSPTDDKAYTYVP
ncbi:bifunctional xylanase/deacetylase precursor [Ruminiclostridium hungatei]|uniref:cellulase n=1 Tax=Ruminiclostridium hungatei TaxID=48256 RepID=A0A1V4SJM6_RUMHU|nr:polysaccharide deacetylase family protein [Ruminiclostridium hungatei]OPX44088.1 bifunctional xylanase/deacetylase precursor [Ruminiclostridium hungatei]